LTRSVLVHEWVGLLIVVIAVASGGVSHSLSPLSVF